MSVWVCVWVWECLCVGVCVCLRENESMCAEPAGLRLFNTEVRSHWKAQEGLFLIMMGPNGHYCTPHKTQNLISNSCP